MGLILAHLCKRYTAVSIVPIHSISIHSLSIAAVGYGRHVPAAINVFIYLPFQQSEELRHRVGVIWVDHCHVSWAKVA
jgi:hypothetical protein